VERRLLVSEEYSASDRMEIEDKKIIYSGTERCVWVGDRERMSEIAERERDENAVMQF
jgi:hypothetical protein